MTHGGVDRREPHRRNLELEGLLAELSDLLGFAERAALSALPDVAAWPVVLIVGCGRSGTTLMLQWLANCGCFAYPSNLLSRFYAAPYVGARIQQLLTDPRFNFNDELVSLSSEIAFESRLGKTKGPLAPNEFWYFWRRFIDFPEVYPVSEAALREVKKAPLCAELQATAQAFERPLAMKAMIMNWNLDFLDRLLERVLFVFVHRDPMLNAQSLLESRRDYFGSEEEWYSFKPPEYARLVERSPAEQVAGQVLYTNAAIRRQLAEIDSSRWLEVGYEELCERPIAVFEAIADRLERQGSPLDARYDGPDRFDVQVRWRLGEARRAELGAALSRVVAELEA